MSLAKLSIDLEAKLANLQAGLDKAGLLAERWFFFAQARHPQNIYYQSVS